MYAGGGRGFGSGVAGEGIRSTSTGWAEEAGRGNRGAVGAPTGREGGGEVREVGG